MKRKLRRLALPEPELSPAEAMERWENEYIPKGCGKLIKEDTLGTLDGEFKFLFLRDYLDFPDAWTKDLRRLPFNSCRSTNRAPLVGSGGGELVMGWWRDPRNERLPPHTYLTTKTGVGDLYEGVLHDILTVVSLTMRGYVPEIWKEALARAKRNGRHVIDGGMGTKFYRRHFPDLYPIFSTITINHNTICRAHVDDGNARGFACMTTYGPFEGGQLSFPRLNVAFDVRPGDLLIADTNHELHGNWEGRKRDRISVVAYLREFKKR